MFFRFKVNAEDFAPYNGKEFIVDQTADFDNYLKVLPNKFKINEKDLAL